VSTEGGGGFRRTALTCFFAASVARIFSCSFRTPSLCLVCVASSFASTASFFLIHVSGSESYRSIGGMSSFPLYGGRLSSLLLGKFGGLGFCLSVCVGRGFAGSCSCRPSSYACRTSVWVSRVVAHVIFVVGPVCESLRLVVL